MGRRFADPPAFWNSRLLARKVTQFMADRMARTGLGVAQFGLLAQVAASKDETLVALAERTGLDASTLTRNLQVLEREGLVEMETGLNDVRRRAVALTRQGGVRFESGLKMWLRVRAELQCLIVVATVRRVAGAAANL